MAEPMSNSAVKMAIAKPLASGQAQGQARLILQDSLAFDQATQPALRSSVELSAGQASSLDREKAREMWESLSLDPELAQERQSERKRLLLRAETVAKEATAAKAQAIELQAQLAKERDERLNHPLVYAGAAGLLGLGALWLLERRKRVQLQERELEALAQQTPSLFQDELPAHPEHAKFADSFEDSPDLAADYATDLSGLPGTPSFAEKIDHDELLGQQDEADSWIAASKAAKAQKEEKAVVELFAEPVPAPAVASSPAPAPIVAPTLTLDSGIQLKRAESERVPDWAQSPAAARVELWPIDDEKGLVAQPWKVKDSGLLSMSKRVLGNMLKRKSQSDAAHSSHLSTQSSTSTYQSGSGMSTQVLRYETDQDSVHTQFDVEAQLAFEQEMMEQNLESIQGEAYDPDQANIELLSQTRVVAQSGESAMEHLLELRTAVTGLAALGRPEGAARLLAEHIAADPGTCAWAYLEYMHLCEQMQQRDDFELMRKQYRMQFNRMAPYWHEPNSNVLGLDGYARAANELCTAWAQGTQHSHQTLAAWLVGPFLGRKLVQLPAYYDLFDLYEMLEFVEHEQSLNSSPEISVSKSAAHAGQDMHLLFNSLGIAPTQAAEQEFVPTVSLLDLDYEFSSDVTLQEREVQQSETAITVVKTGNFSVDFNVAGTQMGSLQSTSAELDKK
jgi:hypothetical protein